MKLLFDQNISFRIVKKIEDFLPNSSQVRLLGLENAKTLIFGNMQKIMTTQL